MVDLLILAVILVILYFLFVKISFGTLLLILGIAAAVVICALWIYLSRRQKNEDGSDDTWPGIKQNFRPLSLLLRIILAAVLYFFLCVNHLIPEILIYIPEFLAPVLM